MSFAYCEVVTDFLNYVEELMLQRVTGMTCTLALHFICALL